MDDLSFPPRLKSSSNVTLRSVTSAVESRLLLNPRLIVVHVTLFAGSVDEYSTWKKHRGSEKPVNHFHRDVYPQT